MAVVRETDYQRAYDIILDAIEKTSDERLDGFSSLAAALTCIMSAAFDTAPSTEAADALVSHARDVALNLACSRCGGEDGEPTPEPTRGGEVQV